MWIRILLPAVIVVSTCELGVAKAPELTIADALSKPLIEPQLPLQEVQAYAESRILSMPEVRSVVEWEDYARRIRSEVLQRIVFRGAARQWKDHPAHVEWLETIDGGTGYHIRKLRYEILPGMWVPALLYEPDELTGKVPVVMNVNGHDRPDGKAADYKQIRCINQAKRGMIALNVEWLGMGQLNTPGFDHYRMNQINLCGSSGLAPFYLAMSRGLDILLEHENADPQRVAVAGLSGGGWQTIIISSLDERVTFCNPVAGYSSFRTRSRLTSDLGDSEQTPCDLASITDYAQLTAMLAPRPALLTKNAEDNCCFRAEHALPPLLEAAQPIYDLYERPRNLRYHINHDPGDHNFGMDNRQQLYAAFADYFYADDSEFLRSEIECSNELQTKAQLHIALPDGNLDFNSLALQLSDQLKHAVPEAGELNVWQAMQLPVLRETVKAKDYHTMGIEQSSQSTENRTTIWRWMRVGGTWTVPAVEIRAPQADPKKMAIVIADTGRGDCAQDCENLLSSGYRVLALDPFYFGESKIAERDFLYAILVSGIGDRPLGIQAGQIASIARWAGEHEGVEEITLCASGPRTSLIGIVAAALSDETIDQVELRGSLGSLRELLEQNKGMNEVPELLCFGLLEHFDVAQLAAMVLPRPVTFHDASARVRDEVLPVLQSLRD